MHYFQKEQWVRINRNRSFVKLRRVLNFQYSSVGPLIVMALYPQTTCFYKAIINNLPQTATADYELLFEDASYPEGYSPPLMVAQRYVIAYKHTKKVGNVSSWPEMFDIGTNDGFALPNTNDFEWTALNILIAVSSLSIQFNWNRSNSSVFIYRDLEYMMWKLVHCQSQNYPSNRSLNKNLFKQIKTLFYLYFWAIRYWI